MSETDRLIDAALLEEERALLAAIGEDKGFVGQALGLFGGPDSWVNWVLMIAQAAAFLAALWAGWRFFAATDVLTALHWGVSAATLLIVALQIKFAMVPVMQANRVIREIKRLELRLAQLR
jgi:hypothetical protein